MLSSFRSDALLLRCLIRDEKIVADGQGLTRSASRWLTLVRGKPADGASRQALLADRFELELHGETRDISVYALVVGKNGPKLAEAKDSSLDQSVGNIMVPPGKLTAHGATMALFVDILTDNLDRPVIDKTNLTGHYDFSLTYDGPSWSPEEHDWKPFGAAVFGPIQDLGLKLDPQKSPVDVLVIDSVDHPSAN